jgi:hypothetical protein
MQIQITSLNRHSSSSIAAICVLVHQDGLCVIALTSSTSSLAFHFLYTNKAPQTLKERSLSPISCVMKIEDLPEELICMVALHFKDVEDPANWRLTSKHFARIVIEAHFKTFTFEFCTSDTLNRLRSVSLQMARHINNLDYDGAKGWTRRQFSHE